MLNVRYLDEYQKNAVFSQNNNSLIVAAPGSGKTTVIINRAIYLIEEKDISSNNIVVITFTKNAAENMKKRYCMISNNKAMPFFGTFHSLFYNILKKHYGEIKIIDVNEAYRIINNVLMKYTESINEEKCKKVMNYMSLIKNCNFNVENENIEIDRQILNDCILTYEVYKKEKNLLDFDDLQIQCRDLFKCDLKILNYYRNVFKYMLIDEFQDSDNIQLEILQMLNKNNSIFAVGDEDQCIYKFRGSKPECMVNFEDYFKEGKKYYLSINYRCPRNIVSMSKKLISNNLNRNIKEIKAFNKHTYNVRIINTCNEIEQADGIYKEINELIVKGNYQLSEFAILYRTNIESRILIDNFLKNKISFNLLDKKYNFYDHFICKDILSYLKLSIDNSDTSSFIRIINKPFRYINKIYIEKLRKKIIKENCFESLENIDSLPLFQIKNIRKLNKRINKINVIPTKDIIEYILNTLNYKDYLQEYCIKYKIDKSELEVILLELNNSLSEYNNILKFIQHINELEIEMKNQKNKSEGILISTIHGVKGMEFKNVFIINCNEDNIPHISNTENNLEEERRLFYVGITRTIHNLWICYPNIIRGKHKSKSRFLDEIIPFI